MPSRPYQSHLLAKPRQNSIQSLLNMSDGASDSDDGNVISIFDEPSGYFQPEKPYTFESFTLDNGTNLELRLVGQNPLWVCSIRCIIPHSRPPYELPRS